MPVVRSDKTSTRIDAGKLAASQSSNDAVKKFAQLMVTDHTGVNKAAVDLATKLKVTPQGAELEVDKRKNRTSGGG